MRRSPWLFRLAALVWGSWLGLVAVILAMLYLRTWDPSPLPAALLAGGLVAALVLLIAAVWRLIRGPGRARALAWLLLGLAPCGFLGGYLMYGFRLAHSRQLDFNLPLKTLIPFGESILDIIARFVYPERTVGERVVMISAPLPAETARRQVAAMDRHIKELEARLGRTSTRRVYWVRGPILGVGGRAIDAMCMASSAGDTPANPDELTVLDRHEVAHVVLSQFCTFAAEPPSTLVEGWAEAYSGMPPEALVLRARADREAGRTRSLADLMGPEWYGRHELAAYTEGAVLADFIIRRFGPGKFLALYTQCRRASFDADCRHTLGLSVDELDQAYWADIDERVGPGGYARHWLSSLELGPDVKPAEWQQFLADYFAAADRMAAPYEHVRLTADQTHTRKDENGKTTNYTWHYEFKRSGQLRALKEVTPDREQVYLARPDLSLHATRKAAGDPWEIRDDRGIAPDQSYQRMVYLIDTTEPVTRSSAPLLQLAQFAMTLVNPIFFKVTKLERLSVNGRALFRVVFDDCPPGHPFLRKLDLQFAADDFLPVHADSVTKTGTSFHSEVHTVFDSHEGVPVLKSSRGESRGEDKQPTVQVLEVTDRSFGPLPEDEFSAERVLGNAPARHIADEAASADFPAFLNWFPLPMALGLASAVAGAGLLAWSGRRAAGDEPVLRSGAARSAHHGSSGTGDSPGPANLDA